MATLDQNLQRPFYVKHLLERLRFGKAAIAMRREAAELIERLNNECSTLSAENGYKAQRIEELEQRIAYLDALVRGDVP
jgi:cell division protein FtsB